MGAHRMGTSFGAAALVGTLLLSGCTSDEQSGNSASDAGSASTGSTGSSASPSGDSELSAFEQQLPLKGDFVSQQTETTGSVVIDRRADGSTWATFTGFSTGDASDLRLHLKEGVLEQDSSGAWVDTAGYSFEIAALDPAQPDQEIEIPGAHTMPEISTLSAVDYRAPDYPSLGSVALTR